MEEEGLSGRLERLEAHMRFWSFYLGPLGEEKRLEKERALEKEYEKLASLWNSVAEEGRPKLKEMILKAYRAYEDAASERWGDMLVLDLVDSDFRDHMREHRHEMELEVAGDAAYALKLRQEFPDPSASRKEGA